MGPFELITFCVISFYLNEQVFEAPQTAQQELLQESIDTMKYSAYECLGMAQGYFLTIMMRDFFAMFSQFRTEHPVAFQEAMAMHIVGLPIDCLILILLSAWGAMIINSIVANDCNS